MSKRNLGPVLLILAALIAITLLVSPVNREALDKESGNSGISSWGYMPSEYRLNSETALDFDSIRSNSDGWTSISALQEEMVVDKDVFWLRGKLPESFSFYSPALLLEFDFPVEVFVEGQKIYSYSTLSNRDRVLKFQHIIPIRDEYKGKMIYFRYPKKDDLSMEEIRYLTKWDMLSGYEKSRDLVNNDLIPVLLCAFSLFFGICLMIIGIFQRNRRSSEARLLSITGGLIFCIAFNILTTFYRVRLTINQPVFIFYADYLSYFSIPYLAGSFISYAFKSKYNNHMGIINKVFMLFLVFTMLLSFIPGFDITKTDYVFNACFLSYAVFLVYLMIRELRSGYKDFRIIVVGLVFAGLTGVFDILTQLNITDYSGSVSRLGIFVLSLSMVSYFGLRYARLYDDIKAANIQLTNSKETIEEINKDLDRKVVEKTSAIRSLFNNAEQGFLSFKEDLIVENEYSFKCCEIFAGDIAGVNLAKLISCGNQEQEKFIKTLLLRVFSLKDAGRREVYFSLLPTELTINEKIINVAYKLIDVQSEESKLTCMVILTDITEKHLLETKLERERSILRMGVKVVANHTDFVNAVLDYKDFCKNRIGEIINSDLDISSKYAELFRAVHTFKGTFAQFELQNITKKLHDFETAIDHFIRVGYEELDLEDLFITNDLIAWLEEDFDILRGVLGERYLRLDKLVVAEESKLKEIESRMLDLFKDSEGLALVKELRMLRYKPIKEMLSHYPEYCKRLSDRLGKPIDEFEIQGSDVAVDPDAYYGLCKVMAHIFRNVMDHGIETAEQRISNGKSELGSISCTTMADEEKIEIIVCDDGAGIDIEEIRKMAVSNSVMSFEEAAAASEEEVIQVLYSDGFTTADEVTELSGRGVGLPAVKAEVEKLKGTIHVESRKGHGTCFRIIVPLLD